MFLHMDLAGFLESKFNFNYRHGIGFKLFLEYSAYEALDVAPH